MTRRVPGSPVYQAEKALKPGFASGQDRHEAKAKGTAKRKIFSRSTMETYLTDIADLIEWVRAEYGVKDADQMTSEHARAYLDSLAARNLSGGYLSRKRSAIAKYCQIKYGTRWDLGGTWHSDARPEWAYTAEQAEELIANLRAHARDPKIANVVKLQATAGLRILESVHLRASDIDPAHCMIRVEEDTKGGKVRVVRVDPQHQHFLEDMKTQGEHNDKDRQHVFRDRGKPRHGLDKRASRAVAEACDRLQIICYGMHGFRKMFAQQRYAEYRAQGMSDLEARETLMHELGHNDPKEMDSYLVDS